MLQNWLSFLLFKNAKIQKKFKILKIAKKTFFTLATLLLFSQT